MKLQDYKFNGFVESGPDPRDYTLETLGLKSGVVSDQIELELKDFVYNQGATDMCTAFASSMLVSMINDTDVQFSPFDLYANKPTSTEGESLRNILKTLYSRGISPKTAYSSDVIGTYQECKAEYEQNKPVADFQAQLGRIRHYYNISTAEDLTEAISLGNPLIGGLMVHENFIPVNGVIPMPDGQLYGGHAILIVGCKKIDGVLYVKILNSWGEDWGIDGTAWVPYEMIIESWGVVDLNSKVKSIYFQIGTDYYAKNGVKHYMKGKNSNGEEVPVVPFLENDRTYIPLKFAAEALEAEVEWWPGGQVIYIKR